MIPVDIFLLALKAITILVALSLFLITALPMSAPAKRWMEAFMLGVAFGWLSILLAVSFLDAG